MFESLNWIFKDEESSSNAPNGACIVSPPADALEYGYYQPDSKVFLLKRFEFVPKLQRMSVIISDPKEGGQRVYVKGSPEMIKSLCNANTLPINFAQLLGQYTEVFININRIRISFYIRMDLESLLVRQRNWKMKFQ